MKSGEIEGVTAESDRRVIKKLFRCFFENLLNP
jgi:hypothetical protein